MKKNTNKTPKNILKRILIATTLATLLAMSVTIQAQTGLASALAVQLAKNTNTAYKPAEIKQPGGTIYFDGKPIDMMGTTILNANSSTLLPIAPIAKALNTEPMWDAENKVAKISYNGHYAECVQGSDKVILDGSTTKKSAVPTINHNSRVYLPLRTLSESLGLNVSYDANTKNVYITTSSQAKPVEPLPTQEEYTHELGVIPEQYKNTTYAEVYNSLRRASKLTEEHAKIVMASIKSFSPSDKIEARKYSSAIKRSQEDMDLQQNVPDPNRKGEWYLQPAGSQYPGWYWNGNNWEFNFPIYYGTGR